MRAQDVDNGSLELLVVLAECRDVANALFRLFVPSCNLDRDELLVPSPSHFTSNIGELLDVLLPCTPDALCNSHDGLKFGVIHVHECLAM